MADVRKRLQVEALTYSDNFDSLVERQLRGRPIHRAEDTGLYNISKLVEKFGSKLIRSRQEYLPAPSGFSIRPEWASLCFQFEEEVFVTMMSKGNSMARSHGGEDEYKVTVTTVSHEKAVSVLSDLRRQFAGIIENQGPAFFIMTGGRRAQSAPIEPEHLLDSRRLALHYGEEFPAWADEFLQGLAETGISIFRGETGTGKTSFLRHAMCALAKTHRFYFVPVDNFGLLSSGSLTAFWKTEQLHYPSASKVLVLEDAETLVSERDHQIRSPVAALLNLTDGLMTQYIKLHLICTLNCKIDDIDAALLRPGRLRFFRNFERIPRARAEQMGEYYKLSLPDQDDFSLAEVFAAPNFSKHTSGALKEKGPVGFSQ